MLTRLQLNRDGLVGAFHQEPTTPVSQALACVAFGANVQHAVCARTSYAGRLT